MNFIAYILIQTYRWDVILTLTSSITFKRISAFYRIIFLYCLHLFQTINMYSIIRFEVYMKNPETSSFEIAVDMGWQNSM